MNAIILSIGDELVLGQTVDTNSAWISQQLAAVGAAVLAHVTVPDDEKLIEDAIDDAANRCKFLIITGGIGPTEDDLTRQALARWMGVELELNETWLLELHKFFEARGRIMPPINRIQAMIPEGAEMLFNTMGTAAGIHVEIDPWELSERKSHEWRKANNLSSSYGGLGYHGTGTCHIFITPGVPKEMKAMFTRDILPEIKKQAGGAVILSRTLHTFGLGESAIAEKLGDLMRRDRNPSVGTTVSAGVVSLRLNARFPSLAEAQVEIDKTDTACQAALGDLIYGSDDQSLAQVVADLLKADPIAQKSAPAVSTAESCTGGLVAKMFTDIAGSSAYFRQGYVTYQNEAKTKLLGVPAELIANHGAVSEEVVRAMALGAQRNAGTPYSLALTGIAGPTGGTPQKPVGTVWIALAHPGGCDARVFLFPGDREMIRDRSAKMALTMLRYHLLGKSLPF